MFLLKLKRGKVNKKYIIGIHFRADKPEFWYHYIHRSDSVKAMSPSRRNCLFPEETQVPKMNVNLEAFKTYNKVNASFKLIPSFKITRLLKSISWLMLDCNKSSYFKQIYLVNVRKNSAFIQ